MKVIYRNVDVKGHPNQDGRSLWVQLILGLSYNCNNDNSIFIQYNHVLISRLQKQRFEAFSLLLTKNLNSKNY